MNGFSTFQTEVKNEDHRPQNLSLTGKKDDKNIFVQFMKNKKKKNNYITISLV